MTGTKSYSPRIDKKTSLSEAVENALNLPTEKDRILAIIEKVRCYRNEYSQNLEADEKFMHEGYEKCRLGLEKLKVKIKEQIESNFSQKFGVKRYEQIKNVSWLNTQIGETCVVENYPYIQPEIEENRHSALGVNLELVSEEDFVWKEITVIPISANDES